ncbi:MAG: saccharopine dehydrogenase family protein [Sporichthyaceae bacterium]
MSPIAVYGAGGYTGRLVLAELKRRNLDMVLAGRGRERLEAAGRIAAVPHAPVRVAGVDDPAALAQAFEGCAAVINCAGPFTRLGEPVVRAAIAARCHYVDTTAEQLYIKRIFDDCSAEAETAGVSVVPAMGYDIVPGDLLCHETAAAVGPVAHLTLAYDIKNFGMTRGSMHSVLTMYTGGEVRWTGAYWSDKVSGPIRRAPVRFDGDARPAPTVRWPAGEIITVPRHVDVEGFEVVMRGDALIPKPASAIAPSLMPIMKAVMKTPVGPRLNSLVDRLPEGPSNAKRERARFAFVATAIGRDGRRARGVLRGTDVYGSTAVIAVAGVRHLLDGGAPAGVLAPAQALKPAAFLDELAPDGISWSVATR